MVIIYCVCTDSIMYGNKAEYNQTNFAHGLTYSVVTGT